MDPSLIAAVIAFIGVLTSVLVSFLSNRKLLRTEIEKMDASIEQNYASKLVDKRLEYYPIIYEPLSNLSKLIRRILIEGDSEKIYLKDLREFRKTYESLNSKYGVVFSSVSSEKSKQLRVYISEILIQNKTEDLNLSIDILSELKEKIGHLEFSLKQDLGIYIVELKDPKRTLGIENYEDVAKQRVKRKPH